MARNKSKPSKKTTKKRPKKLTAEERRIKRERSSHIRLVREAFRNVGFERAKDVPGKNLWFEGVQGEFDDIHILENVLIVAEYTNHKTSNLSAHLKPKKILYDLILGNTKKFIEFLRDNIPSQKHICSKYTATQFQVRVLYASRHSVDSSLKQAVPSVLYYDFPIAQYFKLVSNTIRLSALYEMLHYLRVEDAKFAGNILKPSDQSGTDSHGGYLLPESHSNYDDGFKIVSFYVQPSALLRRAYVLRKEGWRNEPSLYQRMIKKTKVDSIRLYLRDDKRVFLNNIIVTLPSQTEIRDENNKLVEPADLQETSKVSIYLPQKFNTIGIVDGQHRVFSYHEGGSYEDKISPLREQQNLLVTGIVFPPDLADIQKRKFEAQLFYEINTTQTTADSVIKQEINLMIRPFSAEALAREILNKLNNESNPLQDSFQRHFYESGKMKTASIVSYGITPLIKYDGDDSLFSVWEDSGKHDLKAGKNLAVRKRYVEFCYLQIRDLLIGARKKLPGDKWTADRSVEGRLLNTTNVNGFLSCLRRIIESGGFNTNLLYEEKFYDLDKFDFSSFKSSQYNKMGLALYQKFFQ